MKKIVHRQDIQILEDLPPEVLAKIEEIVGILDDEYSVDRDWGKSLGGYILVAETENDVKSMGELFDFEYLPEYVEVIKCKKGQDYTNSLMLLSSDYSLSLFIPKMLTPKILLESMEKEAEGGVRV
jgi:hypothetical protein